MATWQGSNSCRPSVLPAIRLLLCSEALTAAARWRTDQLSCHPPPCVVNLATLARLPSEAFNWGPIGVPNRHVWRKMRMWAASVKENKYAYTHQSFSDIGINRMLTQWMEPTNNTIIANPNRNDMNIHIIQINGHSMPMHCNYWFFIAMNSHFTAIKRLRMVIDEIAINCNSMEIKEVVECRGGNRNVVVWRRGNHRKIVEIIGKS